MYRGWTRSDWVWWFCTFGLVGIAVGIAAWRIHTYATGQDPAIYIHLARTLLREPIGSDAFRGALLHVAPGYPLLLAASIRLFGEFAPFWVNPCCLVLGMGALAMLLAEEYGSAANAGLATLWTCLLLLVGYGLNPHFLLYPFRESPAWCLAIAGLWLTHRSANRDHSEGVGAGGLLLLAACSVREPMVVAALCAAGWLLSGSRRIHIWWFVAPFGAGALGALLFASKQVRFLFARWRGLGVEGSEVVESAMGILATLQDELHGLGLGFLLVGIWVGRKRAATWWFFLLPAFLLVLCHAWMGMHRRYVLMVLAFLLPVAGLGFARVVELVQDTIAERIAGWSARELQAMVLGVVGVGLSLVAFGLEPWGPQVRRTELREFKAAVASFAEPGDRIYSEWACRHLSDAVGSFTEARAGGNPLPVDYTLGLPGTGYFLQPLNEEAIYPDDPHPATIRMENLLRYSADLHPLNKEVTIAGGRFAVFRIAAWTAHQVTNRVHGKANRRLVIWLDLQGSSPSVSKHIRIRCPETNTVLLECEVKEGNGLMAFALHGSRLVRRVVDVEVSSNSALPARVVCHATFDDQPIVFTLLDRRLRSLYDWFQPPFVPLITERKHLAQMREGGTLRLPPVYGDATSMEAALTLTPSAGAEGEIRVSYGENTFDESLNKPQMWHGFKVPLDEGESPEVQIAVTPPDCHGSHLRVEQIKLWVR